mmetsp:Transcript_89412/g.268793  ORF Transcript_89412/g.268793 Transcript_89412/m.268793 type:complete len:161 (+) Transcript_89412:3-485(+)
MRRELLGALPPRLALRVGLLLGRRARQFGLVRRLALRRLLGLLRQPPPELRRLSTAPHARLPHGPASSESASAPASSSTRGFTWCPGGRSGPSMCCGSTSASAAGAALGSAVPDARAACSRLTSSSPSPSSINDSTRTLSLMLRRRSSVISSSSKAAVCR